MPGRGDARTADALVADLRAHSSDAERAKLRGRLAREQPVIGVRMGTLFELAKARTAMPLAEVHRLLDRPEFEARLAAVCVLDFRARSPRLPDAEREAGYRTYLERHDRIDSWDMVDRAAPHVVGRWLLDRPRDPLFALARSADVHERRTAITAPLYWARYGTPAQTRDLFAIAEALVDDEDPVVAKPVGIALKHAGVRDEPALLAFLDAHAARMPRPALRYAVEKLDPGVRARVLSG